MRNMRKRLLIICILLCSLCAHAQLGRQFWFASPEMALHSADMRMYLCIAADSADADVTIAMPAMPSYSAQTVHVSAFDFQRIILAEDYASYMQHIAAYHNQIQPRAIQITASAPVSCYVQMTGVNGEIYTLKAENAIGKEFAWALQNQYRNSNSTSKKQTYANAYASAQIVATEDSTTVDIYPTRRLYGDTTILPRRVMLHRGEVYSFRADSKRAEAHPTATRIIADKPIAVLTMDDSMSPYQKYYGEDAVADQQVPVSLLSNDYIAIGNGLKWEGVLVTDITTDSTEFIPMNGRPALYIHRDHPTQVFQITGYGNEAGGTQLPQLYDGGSKRVLYARPSDSQWTKMHILTPATNIHAIYVDAQPVDTALFQPVPEAEEWAFATINISHLPLNRTIAVHSEAEKFHLAIIDASSAAKNKHGQSVPTSCSFGYFSDYAPAPEAPDTIPSDTVLIVVPPDINTPPDTITPPDTVLIVVPPDTIPSDTVRLLPPDTVPAKARKHHLMMYMQGAYAHHILHNNDFRWGLSYGVGLGFLYEYRHKHFLLNVGVGVLWQDVELRSQTKVTTPFVDSQGDDCTLHMKIHRKDRARMGYIEVPFLVGGQWSLFYLLGGIKVGVPLWGNTVSEARMTDIAMYDRYFVPFSNMANHGLQTDVPTIRDGALPTIMADTRLSLEMGLNLDRYRLGVYADYGAFWTKQENNTLSFMELTNPVEPATWSLRHPFNCSLINNAHPHNFMAGIKFTIVLY